MRAESYICPSCRSPIPLDDINVSKDLALCRNCGKKAPFSSLGNLDSAAAEPPKRVHIETDFLDGSVKITCRYLSLPFLLFFIPFMVFWSGFSIYNIYGRQLIKKSFDLELSLFGLPFALGTIALLIVLAFVLGGKTIIVLRRGRGTVITGIGGIGRKREFICNVATTVGVEQTNIQMGEYGQTRNSITVRNGKNVIRFGRFLPNPTLQYIHSQILRQCFPR